MRKLLEDTYWAILRKIKTPFGVKVILKYSVKNTEVSNTLRCLDVANTLVLENEVSFKTSFFLPY
jgi:hypothetical protein